MGKVLNSTNVCVSHLCEWDKSNILKAKTYFIVQFSLLYSNPFHLITLFFPDTANSSDPSLLWTLEPHTLLPAMSSWCCPRAVITFNPRCQALLLITTPALSAAGVPPLAPAHAHWPLSAGPRCSSSCLLDLRQLRRDNEWSLVRTHTDSIHRAASYPRHIKRY